MVNFTGMTPQEIREWYEKNIPHYRELCRVGKDEGWVAAGDEKYATIALKNGGGKYLLNVRWDEIEFTGGKMVPLYEDI